MYKKISNTNPIGNKNNKYLSYELRMEHLHTNNDPDFILYKAIHNKRVLNLINNRRTYKKRANTIF